MAITTSTSHHLQLYPNLPLGLGRKFYRPPSLPAILGLDTAPALKEKFRLREFTLGIPQEDVEERLLPGDADGSPWLPSVMPLGTGSESLSQELQVQGLPETTPALHGSQGDGALPEVAGLPHARVKPEQAEDGEAGEGSGGALDLLFLATVGAEAEKRSGEGGEDGACPRPETSCPVCDTFSTDSAMVLSAHIVECLAETSNQKGKGRKKMRSILDVIAADAKCDSFVPDIAPPPVPPPLQPAPPETNEVVVKVADESLGHAGREMQQGPPVQVTQGVKRSFRKRVASRKSADFIMEPVKKRMKRKPGSVPYKGIKQRTSGRWAAEISDAARKIRLWLGTFDTPEEAAMAYDRAAVKIRGAQAQTNILSPEAAAAELPAPVAAGEADTGELVPTPEGINVVRSRKGRRKQKPEKLEKLPLKEEARLAPGPDKGSQSEIPPVAETTVPVTSTSQEDHNVKTATTVTPLGNQNTEMATTAATPVTPLGNQNTETATMAATPVTPLGDQNVNLTPPESPASPPEIPVPLKMIYPSQAATEDDNIVVASGRLLGKGRPPKVKREGAGSVRAPAPSRGRARANKRKREEDLESLEGSNDVVIGSMVLEILD